MLTYKNVLDSNRDIKMVRVFVDGRFAGTIEQVDTLPAHNRQWKYFPDGHRKLSGPSMPTIAEVKKSLEAE